MSNPAIAIPADRLSELEGVIEKLNKKAAKLGCKPISLEIGDKFEKQVSAAQWADFIPVKVTGEAPKLNGWVLVATLEHDENGALIRRLPTFFEDDSLDLTQYRKATPDNCDHCHTRRRRNDTYVVARSEADRTKGVHLAYAGPPWETKQVGSSCLKDFTGHENPEAIARHMQNVRDFIESVQGGSYEGGHITPRHDLLAVMAVAASEIRQHGYVTRKQAWENQELVSTSEATRTAWHRFRSGAPLEITEEDKRRAVNAVEWVRSLKDEDLENDFLANLYTTCKGSSLIESQFGFAAAALYAHQNRKREDGDRHKATVTRTQDDPTEPQIDFIKRLTDELGEATPVPKTRLEASNLINELKIRVAEKKTSGQPKKNEPATSKQLTLINTLMDKRSIPPESRRKARAKIDSGLTKTQASKCIEWLQDFPEAK